MKRLVCIVEGEGEVAAIPCLCARILQYLGAEGWIVDRDPIRQPRSKLVDEKVKSPHRPCNGEGVRRATAMARARPADAVLVLCDADDDCPAIWGPDAMKHLVEPTRGAGVMAQREYEAWVLLSYTEEQRKAARVRNPEQIRDAKGELRKLIRGYLPTVHQLAATRQLDISRVRARSDSFDKLVRAIASLCGVRPPSRPSVGGA
jgi:Domain of unknown function (DUF4276)